MLPSADRLLLLPALLGLLCGASADLSEREAPIPGYKVVDLIWSAKPHPNKEPVRLTGHIQSVVSQLEAINPNYRRDFADVPHPSGIVPPLPEPELEARHTKRGSSDDPAQWPLDYRNIKCGPQGQDWSSCDLSDTENNRAYLAGVKGVAGEGPGPGACGQVACNYGSSVWWCNDNSTSVTYDGGFFQMSVAVGVVQYYCANGKTNHILGQYFNTDNTNVIVRGGVKC